MARDSGYRGIIFDYGGVLVEHQRDSDIERLAQIANIRSSQMQELYWSNRLPYDKDLVSAAEYWQTVARQANVALTQEIIDQLVEYDNTSWMRFDGVMWDWIVRLRDCGKRVAMLSNMPRDLGEALRTRTRKLEIFDQVTLSFEVRSAKPEPVIYKHCLEELGLPSAQMIFLDDRIENVRGAEALGIRAIQFNSRDQISKLFPDLQECLN